MGNHYAGRAMVNTAVALAENTDKAPLEILDIACGPYRGTDAEFDGEQYPPADFGNLLTKAFDPEGQYDLTNDEDEFRFFDNVLDKFKERYELW